MTYSNASGGTHCLLLVMINNSTKPIYFEHIDINALLKSLG